MADQQRLWPRIDDQREANDFEFAEFFEHSACFLDNPLLVATDLANNPGLIFIGDPEKRADRPCGFNRLSGCKELFQPDARRAPPLNQVDQEPSVTITPHPELDRSAHFGIEKRRILYPQ